MELLKKLVSWLRHIYRNPADSPVEVPQPKVTFSRTSQHSRVTTNEPPIKGKVQTTTKSAKILNGRHK